MSRIFALLLQVSLVGAPTTPVPDPGQAVAPSTAAPLVVQPNTPVTAKPSTLEGIKQGLSNWAQHMGEGLENAIEFGAYALTSMKHPELQAQLDAAYPDLATERQELGGHVATAAEDPGKALREGGQAWLDNAKETLGSGDTARVTEWTANQVTNAVGILGAAKKVATLGKVGKALTEGAEAGAKVPLSAPPGERIANADPALTCTGDSCGGPLGSCFVAGTRVELSLGDRPIEQVELGARVRTESDERCAGARHDAPLYRVRLRMPTEDGSGDVMDLELLRDEAWLDQNDISLGADVALNIEEMLVSGEAHVEEVSLAEAIPDGPGCAVTGRITHYSASILSMGLDGTADALRVTTVHPMYSATRGAWVAAGDLEPGELLTGDDAYVTVSSIDPVPMTARVYNLEVEAVHTFRVSAWHVLVHNACPDKIVYPTDKLAADAAKKLGYTKVNELSQKRAVFVNPKGSPRYITADRDGHIGGAWKGANTVEALASKGTRLGTYDVNLVRIGD